MDFETQVMREAFPAMVGRQLSCPRCGDILDCRRAVMGLADGAPIVCANCFDGASGDYRMRWGHEPIIDGRTMWTTRTPSPRKPRVKRTRKARDVRAMLIRWIAEARSDGDGEPLFTESTRATKRLIYVSRSGKRRWVFGPRAYRIEARGRLTGDWHRTGGGSYDDATGDRVEAKLLEREGGAS